MKTTIRLLAALLLSTTLALPAQAGEGSNLALTRMGQAGAGLVLGIAGAYLGSLAGQGMDPCNEKDDESSAVDLCGSSGTNLGAVGGYLLGTTAGIYGTGLVFGRDGSLWATTGGAAVGLLAGVLVATQTSESPGLQVISTLALSQGLALLGYHWTDRVQVKTAFETVPGSGEPGTSAKPKLALRPEVQVTLARF